MGTEQDVDIERIISHENYHKPITLSHDIALLKLKRPVYLNKEVGLVCLPNDNIMRIYEGKNCWVTGRYRPI
jgi:trypsin